MVHINSLFIYIHFAYNLIAILEPWFETEVHMTIWKRAKRLWILLATEEYFDESGTLGRRTVIRRAPRA